MGVKGTCAGISVGPGESGCITEAAKYEMFSRDVIFLPSAPKEECRAYQIIKKAFGERADSLEYVCTAFTMSPSTDVQSARHEEILRLAVEHLDAGRNIAFLALGDAALYSTYIYIHEQLEALGYSSVLIPGVSSVQAACARLGIPLAKGSEEVHVFPGADGLKKNLRLPGTKVFMKPGRDLENTVAVIKKYVYEHAGTRVYGVSNLGMEGETIATDIEELDRLSGYFTVIIVKGEEREAAEGSSYFENRSCSCYPCHESEDGLNCLFCYCPLYSHENCPGTPEYRLKGGKRIKVCTGCTFPHKKENYPVLTDILRKEMT